MRRVRLIALMTVLAAIGAILVAAGPLRRPIERRYWCWRIEASSEPPGSSSGKTERAVEIERS